MTNRLFSLRSALWMTLIFAVGCEDDAEDKVATGLLDASVVDGSIDATSVVATQADAEAGAPLAPPPPVADPLYVIGSSIQTTSQSTQYLWTTKQIDGAKLDLKQATEISGASQPVVFQGKVYIPNSETKTITRYELQGDKLVAGPVLSLVGQGLQYLSYIQTILNAERAFIVSYEEYRIIEWNPTTMKITTTHDLSALKRQGWGDEYRNGYMRSDGKLFFQWAYTNDRVDFINSFVLGVFDTNTNTLTVEEDASCPATAGFGGFFDEQEDLYLIADSFGLFTQFGGFKDPKPACILRVKKGEAKLDTTFKQHPSDALGGRFPWGFYYLGNGLAFTSAIDPAITAKYNSVFEILFAPEHTGYLLNLRDGSAREIQNLPKDGVGFESHNTDGRLFVPRSTGSVTIENIQSTESTLFEIKADATATPLMKLPGYISPVARIR